jgi:peptidoglycan/xylan/chitin deacetylase (PgdA/CDA1 family)
MPIVLKKLLKAAMASQVGWKLAQPLRPNGITVLMYHRVNRTRDAEMPGIGVDQFLEQMTWLRARCRIIAPEEFTATLRQDRSGTPAVLVTFDDGYRDFFDNAYPILAELNIPSLVFLATRFMDDGGLIWTDAVATAVLRTRRADVVLPWNNQRHGLADKAERNACRRMCTQFLKGIPDPERVAWQSELFRLLDIVPEDVIGDRQMLTWDEIRATRPLTRYGGHTHSHPILSQLDRATAEQEIRTCRDRITTELGEPPRYFAYPNGRAQDFTDETKAVLQNHGFELSFSTIEGIHQSGTDLYAIRRQPTGCSTLGDFASLVLGR